MMAKELDVTIRVTDRASAAFQRASKTVRRALAMQRDFDASLRRLHDVIGVRYVPLDALFDFEIRRSVELKRRLLRLRRRAEPAPCPPLREPLRELLDDALDPR